ncbi:hypothetical protein CCP3SC5AM1_1420003 [Gammaproteobacteria bacterium]
MVRIVIIARALGFLGCLITLTESSALDVAPLPRTIRSSDPSWIHRLPPATLLLPKATDYREIPKASTESNPTPNTPHEVESGEVKPVEIKSENVSRPPDPSFQQVVPEIVPLASSPPKDHPAQKEDIPQTNISSLNQLPATEKFEKIRPVHAAKKRTFSPRKDVIFWQVQLMQERELEKLREYRQSFATQYADLLQETEPLISLDEASGYFYLHLKPMPNEKIAQNWCENLQARSNANCFVMKKAQTVPFSNWQIQLIAQHDLAEIKLYRKKLVSQHRNLLKNYPPIITISESGEYFRLRLPPIPDEATAQKMCSMLKNRGVVCLVIKNNTQRE